MFICKYCNREFNKNAGGMVHQKQCTLNPDRVSYQLGRKAWNKGLSAETDDRIASLSLKISEAMMGRKPGNWNPNRIFYQQYRTDCKFNFSVYDYPDEFDLTLIDQFGWYKAKNRGDNIHGVTRDHMISVKFGWENKIDSKIISHPANCNILLHLDNVRKNRKNSISLAELLVKIDNWNIKYNSAS